MRFAHTASDRGEVVPCMVTPELVRHEWQWDAHDSLTGSGSYVYRPVYEVRLEWEYPAGVVREMVFVDTYQSDHLFDRLFPQEEPVQYYTKYALPGVRDTSRDLYLFGCGMTSDEAQEKKPAPGVFTLERPMHPATVEISGLVDPLNPEVTVPFVMESGSRIRTVLRSVTKLCGMSMNCLTFQLQFVILVCSVAFNQVGGKLSGQPAQALTLPSAKAHVLQGDCMCAVEPWSNGGVPSVGCGSWGYGKKWCYVAGPNCTDSSSGKNLAASKSRYCSGYRCVPYYQLPGLQYLELRVQTVLASPSPVVDWPDCCNRCSMTEDCAARRCAMFLLLLRSTLVAVLR